MCGQLNGFDIIWQGDDVTGLIGPEGELYDKSNYYYIPKLLKSNFKSCFKCDLRGENLSNVNLSGANLSGANLSNANLRGTNLSDVNLENSKLVSTNFNHANLTNANLSKSVLVAAQLEFAQLVNTNLRGIKLDRRTSFFSANMRGADLREVDIPRSYSGFFGEDTPQKRANLSFKNAIYNDSTKFSTADKPLGMIFKHH